MTTEIIVLCHNALAVTQEFLSRLFKNTKDFHLTLIDNGSSEEGMVSWLNDFAAKNEITLVLNKENTGVIGGRNQGYEIVAASPLSGDYICFLDNDQYVDEGWLEHHHSVLANEKDLVGVEAWQMSATFLPIKQASRLYHSFSYVGCGGMLMKKEVPEKIGMFDPIFNPAYFEDPDLNFRAHYAGFRIGWNCKARIHHLPHQTLGKNSQRVSIFMQSLQKFRKKWKGSRPPILRQQPMTELLDGTFSPFIP